AEVQPFNFGLFIGAHSCHRIAYLEDNPRAYNSEPPSDQRPDQIVNHLPGIAVDQPHGLAHAQVVNLLGCENACEDRAHGSADSVDTESIQSIVVAELTLDHADHEIARYARY